MEDYQREFFDLALECGVLRFGEFTLKSGRVSPYFFNSGLFDRGSHLAALGRFYARAIVESGIRVDSLFGPAYKGIPLVSTTAVALADHHDRDLPWAFNRKEAKDHGEGGQLVGARPVGETVIIDDVVSAGTSVRESVEILRAVGARPAGVAIALDRRERGQGERAAVDELADELDLKIIPIAGLDELLEFVAARPEVAPWHQAVADYRERYGA